MNREHWVELVLTGALPGDNQAPHGVEALGIAAAGMPSLHWAALRWRYLSDRSALPALHAALYRVALESRYVFVRARAPLLARLALCEEAEPQIVGRLKPETITGAFLLCDCAAHQRPLLRAYRDLRARADTWARSGLAQLGRG